MAWLQTAGQILGYLCFYLVMVAGMVVVPLGVPGEFVIVGAVLVFTLVAGSAVLPWWVFFSVLGLGIAAEGLEALVGFLGPRKARGSLWSCFGAVGGGLVGAVVGAPFGLVIGALAGAFIGTFLGAFLVEYVVTRERQGAADVAVAAVIARVLASIMKVGLAFAMIVLVTVALLV